MQRKLICVASIVIAAGISVVVGVTPAANVFLPVKSDAKLGKQAGDFYLLPTS
jgi:hypothetical protein